jgi:hypothetical protein
MKKVGEGHGPKTGRSATEEKEEDYDDDDGGEIKIY